MLLFDHKSLLRIKPHLHLYIYNIHNLQIQVKNISNFFTVCKGNPGFDRHNGHIFFIITSLRTSVKPQRFETLSTRTFVHQ